MDNIRIVVIGLGYVGLPLARLFSTKYETLGFDVNRKRVSELMNGVDSTLEVTDELLKEAIDLKWWSSGKMRQVLFFIL